jgi:glutamine amidotransferase
MENTHPFRRVLGGQTHVFAHNGTLDRIDKVVHKSALTYLPIGETDSELAFCLLLSRLKPLYARDEAPPLDLRFDTFLSVCDEMANLGSSNFLYYDGEVLFAHAHKRIYEEGGKHDGPKPPGLYLKQCSTCTYQEELCCPGLKVGLPDSQVVLLASVPLDDEGWEALDEGTVLAVKDGEVLEQT